MSKKSNKILAQELKSRGNTLFAVGKYNEAISCYTSAIIKNPSEPIYYTNRALCYFKLKQWESACDDCHSALYIDSSLVKGHFLLGVLQIELKSYDEAIKSLEKANDLSKEKEMSYGNDIADILRTAKKKQWEELEKKRILEESNLQDYLNKLILDEREKLTKAANAENLDEGELAKRLTGIEIDINKRLDDVNMLFAQLEERRKNRIIPDYLCSNISFELMLEPVITPSGITYERKDIEEHLKKVGHFDPVTRKYLTQDQLVPNLALKKAVDRFVAENEWAVIQ